MKPLNLVALLASFCCFFSRGADCFQIEEIAVLAQSACPCPDEVGCLNVTNTENIPCVKLLQVYDLCPAEMLPSGIADCVNCTSSGLQWCKMNLTENVGVCSTEFGCLFQKGLFPDLFPGDFITSPGNCPGTLCPDCFVQNGAASSKRVQLLEVVIVVSLYFTAIGFD